VTLQDYASLAEIIGVAVVVITLIYVAVQVRQGSEALRSDARQAAIALDQENVYRVIDYPDLGVTHSGRAPASFEDKARLQFWIVSQMRVREFEWLQYRAGRLDELTWLSYRNVIYFVLGSKRARQQWALCAPYFNPEFAEEVATMLRDAPEIDFWEGLDAIE
jgi:hypothetical protein